jgi:hypothetical protein
MYRKRRQVCAGLAVAGFDLLDETRGALLVGDGEIEAGIGRRGVAEKRGGHRHVGRQAHAGWPQAGAFARAGQLESFTEIEKRNGGFAAR